MGSTTSDPSRARRRTRRTVLIVALTLTATVGVLAAPIRPAVATSAAPSVGSSAASTAAWMTAMGRDLMGRDPSSRVRASWLGQLQAGLSRSALSDRVSHSDFADDLVIRSAYARVLGRAPTADWATTWFTRLRDGTQANELVVGLYGSAELYLKVGGTPAAITDHLYRQILGRPPTAARRADVIRQLAAGVPRTDLAEHLWRSAEGAGRRVDAAFLSLLGRPASGTSRTTWTERLRLADDQMLLAAIVANAEYDTRAPARAAAVHVADQPLPVGTAGVAYRAALQASGGTPPYTFSVVGLPVGLTASGSTIDGTTFAAGTTFVSLTARDAVGHTASRRVALSIVGPLLPRVEMFGPDAGDLDTGVLTAEGTDTYRFTRDGRSLTVAAAPGNRGSNLRMVVVPRTSPAVTSSESCATWTSASSDLVQQGAALQVRIDDSRVRALTVTKNMFFGVGWRFNLHTFDTSRAEVFSQFGQIDLSRTFLDADWLKPLPWHLCARSHLGYLELKAWPATEAEPAWGDPLHGGRAPIPTGWNTTGRTGWYMGHLHPGEQSRYDDLATWQIAGSADRTTPHLPSPAPEPDAVVGTGTDALAIYDAG